MKKTVTLMLNAAVMTGASLIINSVAMWFNVYLSNKIGAQAMGIFQLISSVYVFAVTVAVSGIGLATTRLVAEELAVKRERGAVTAVGKCMCHAVFFGVLSAVLLAGAARYISINWLREPLTLRLLYILAISLPFIGLSSVLSGYFTAVQRVVKSTAAQMLGNFTRIYLTIQIIERFMPNDAEGFCLSIVLGTVISEAISFFYYLVLFIYDQKKLKLQTQASGNLTNRMLAISMPVAFSSYMRCALSSLKQIITPRCLEKSGMTNAAATAQYGVMCGMVLPTLLFPSCFLFAFSSLLVPEVARFHVGKHYGRINYVCSVVFNVTLLFSIGVSAGLFAFANEIGETLYSGTNAAVYIRLLAPLVPIMYFDNIVDGLLKGLNEQVSVVRINIIDTIATIGLISFLLPAYGINGYIIVLYISEALNVILSIRRLMKSALCKIELYDWILKPAIAAVISVAVSKTLPFSSLTLRLTAGGALYTALLYGFNCFPSSILPGGVLSVLKKQENP